MKYFNLLPKITYANAEITNLFYTYALMTPIDNKYLYDYRVKTGETLESIAYKEYNNSRLWWVLAIINNIHDMTFDFLIDDNTLRMDAEAQATTGDVLDDAKFLSIYEILSDQNEDRRNIKILSSEYLNKFLSDAVSLSPLVITNLNEIDSYTYTRLDVSNYDKFFNDTGNIIQTIEE